MMLVSCAMAMLSWLSTISRISVVPDPIGPTMKMGPPAAVFPVVASGAMGSADTALLGCSRRGRPATIPGLHGGEDGASSTVRSVLLSVVLVVRRHQAWIRPTLRSVLDQDTSGVEVVVVDDASPDHTPRILAEAANGDHRVILHRTDRVLGVAGARARALELATGDHVWLLEPTDLVRPGALAGLTAALAGDPDVLLLGEVVRDLYGGERPPDAAPGDRPVLRDRLVRRQLLATLADEVGGDAFSEIPL